MMLKHLGEIQEATSNLWVLSRRTDLPYDVSMELRAAHKAMTGALMIASARYAEAMAKNAREAEGA